MISVIMTSYNEQEEVLRASVDSVLGQTYRDFELIVILDDPENAVHRRILSEYAARDSRFRYYVNDVNLKQRKSLNYALSLSRGEYIARMDADDVCEPDRLEKELSFLTENGLDLIGGLVKIMTQDGKPVYRVRKVPSSPERVRFLSRFGDCLAHPTWLGRREVFTALGGYRDFPCASDYDLQVRALLAGYKLSNLQENVLSYRRSAGGVSQTNLLRQYLFMVELSHMYRSGRVADESVILSRVSGRFNEERARKYARAESMFYDGLSCLSSGRLLKAAASLLPIPFLSPFFFDKAFRFLILYLFS